MKRTHLGLDRSEPALGDERRRGGVCWWLAGLLLLLGGSLCAPAQVSQILFADALQNGWEDWSWCSRSLTNTSPVHSGSRSISAACAPYEALRFYHPPFSTVGYTSLVFWAHGGSAGGQRLRVNAETNGTSLTQVFWTAPLAAGAWQRIEVPLSSLGATNASNLTGIWLYNFSASPLLTFYVDDITLEPLPQPPGSSISLEAEDGVLIGTSVSAAVPGYSGGGYVTGFDASGDLVRWNFSAGGGLYRLLVRFRSPYGPKGFDTVLNGSGSSNMFPQTNVFSLFDAGLVELAAGANTLEIGGGWNYYEIDRVDFVPERAPAPPWPVPAAPADPQATFAARMLLADLVSAYGRVAWSGQQEAAEATNVFNICGRWPVIVSGDFMDYSPSRIAYGANPGQYTETQIGLEARGHAQAMCWHWNAPTNLLNTAAQPWWRGFYTEATTFDIAAALANTNSIEYALVLRDIDAIAQQLKKFATNNIPVLWRPLHEAEGGWFWWGAKGPEPYKQLWRLLFNRLTQHHGLHNLLWVLSSEDPAWCPGNDVVDIIGVDGYPTDRSDPLSARWEALKSRFNGLKLIALSEFGGVPDIEKMHRFGVWFVYFAPWGGSYGPTSMPASTVVRIYQSPEVVTLDEANARAPRTLSVTRTEAGELSLAGTGPRGASYRVLASTNAALPAGQWVEIGTGRFAGGVFSLTDPQAANFGSRYYRLALP